MVCCGLCWCCEDGISFSDLITEPPTTEEVQRFMEMLQGKADPDGDDDTCLWCFPKSILCGCCRCMCPTFCAKPDPVATVDRKEVVEASKASGSKSFLGNALAAKYLAKLFASKSASKVRIEYLVAGLTLLSVGSMQEKLKALFSAFAHAVGGAFNRQALERTVRSLLKTVIDIAAKVSDTLSGALVPGGRAVRLMLAALNGVVGDYFVTKRVDEMLKGDRDGDGAIGYEEFITIAMGKKSLVRKTLQWVADKTAIMRGEKEPDLTGRIMIDGVEVWAFVHETDVDADQKIEWWTSESALAARSASDRAGVISLQEPCSFTDGAEDNDNWFEIVDKDNKRWRLEALDRESFLEWYDAVDQFCDAELEDRELEGRECCFGICS
eukprot:m.237429 g.237429  ORF g.237429 m.237429 type:complete len:382 (-) comp15793_c1_seq1:114-1259(-)